MSSSYGVLSKVTPIVLAVSEGIKFELIVEIKAP